MTHGQQNPFGAHQSAHGIQNPVAAGSVTVASAPRLGALRGWAIALLVVGLLAAIGGLVLLIGVGAIFVLGGGGDVNGFDEAFGPAMTGGQIALIGGLVTVAASIAMFIIRGVKRRAWVRANQPA